MLNDNICAIATAYSNASISCIRVSGSSCFTEINKIVKKLNILEQEKNTIKYAHIYDNDTLIDEVMIAKYISPKSFSGEDMLEIFTHGGVFVTQKVLDLILKLDIRMANPGEFSQRAYLNNRIDLVQAESIMDVVSADNISALKIANSGLSKNISKTVLEISDKIMDLITKIEVNIDYPEYEDIEVFTNDLILPRLNNLIKYCQNIIKLSKRTQVIKDGIKTAIIGSPNVGKSSLLNALLGKNRAIVTSIAGTTRDTIEDKLKLENITLNLIDTAGIRKTDDKIEKIGVSKSRKILRNADLVLVVVDASKKLKKEDLDILDLTKNKKRIIISNKIDKSNKYKIDDSIEISAKKKIGISNLENQIIKILKIDEITKSDKSYLSSIRQIDLLNRSLNSLKNAKKSTILNMPVDIINIDLSQAYKYISEILGRSYDSDIPKNIFKNFCLGK